MRKREAIKNQSLETRLEIVRRDKEKEETKKQKAKTDRMKETNFLLTTGEGEFKKW